MNSSQGTTRGQDYSMYLFVSNDMKTLKLQNLVNKIASSITS